MHFIQQHFFVITATLFAALAAILFVSILIGFGVAVGTSLQEGAAKKWAVRRTRTALAADVIAGAEHSLKEASRATREEQ